MAYKQLGDILVSNQCTRRDAIQSALRKQSEGGGSPRLGRILIDDGEITAEGLVNALSEQYGMPVCPHEHPAEHLFLEEDLPFPFMIEHRILLQTAEERLCAITDDPSDSATLEAARLYHGARLPVYLVSEEQMDEALVKVHSFAENNIASMMADAEVHSAADWGDEEEHLRDLALEAPVVRIVNLIITQAVEKRASDIHTEVGEYALRVRYRVDGVLHEAESIDKKHHAAVVSRIKLLAKLDIAERRIPQDGRIKMQIHGHDLDMRVATTPTIYGENVVIRLLNQQQVELNFASLGMPATECEPFTRMVSQPQGFILVTGPITPYSRSEAPTSPISSV